MHLGLGCMFVYTALYHQHSSPLHATRPALTCDSVDQLSLRPRQLRRLLEPLDRLVDLALLQAELGKSSNGDVAFWVDLECFFAQRVGAGDILLPLKESEGFVDEGEDVAGFPTKARTSMMPHRPTQRLS